MNRKSKSSSESDEPAILEKEDIPERYEMAPPPAYPQPPSYPPAPAPMYNQEGMPIYPGQYQGGYQPAQYPDTSGQGYHQAYPPQQYYQQPPQVPYRMQQVQVQVVGTLCPTCGFNGVPIRRRVPSAAAWISCILLFFIFWPAMCYPFLMDSCYEKQEICPNGHRLY